MISFDRKIFEKESAVRARMIAYAKEYEIMHIVVFTNKGFKEAKLAENCTAHPTNSLTRFLYVFDAIKIGKDILSGNKLEKGNWRLTTQDPCETGLVGLQLKNKFNIPLHVQLHTDVFSPYFAKLSILNHIRVMIARRVLRHADSIRVVSNRIKESIAPNIKLKLHMPIEVRPIEVNTEKIKNAPIVVDLHHKYSQFKKIILMVGRLEKEKNYQMALEAFAMVRAKLPSIGLIIVGEGRTKLNAGANVIIEAWSDHIYSYMKTADILLHTSWYEGYGMVLKEAEACGLPIVSTDVGIAREVGAHIVKHNSESIAQGIIEKLQ